MGTNDLKAVPEDLKGKIVEEVAITDKAVVIKFKDGTFLDVYLDASAHALKVSSNRLES